jgi:Tol biopolymer transport system component
MTLHGHTGSANAVSFNPKGPRLVTSAWGDREVKVWDATTGHEILAYRGHSGPVFAVAFSPDGRWVASVARGKPESGEIKIWDASTGQDHATLVGHGQRVRPLIGGVAFSPDGLHLATSCQDKTVVVWDLKTGQALHTLRGHTEGVMKVAFSPDGRHIASASDDQTVRVWEMATGRELMTLRGHTREPIAVAYSPDGRRLATASNDRTVKIWDSATGQEVLTLRGHPARVFAVAFSPDGQRLASGGEAGSVRIWEATQLTPQLRTQREAGALVNQLTNDVGLKSEVILRLNEDKHLGEEVRREALQLAERFHEDPFSLRALSYATARQPGLEVSKYRLAFRQAETACRLLSSSRDDNFVFVCTLGTAQYRLGQYKEAQDSLAQADSLYSAWVKRRQGDQDPYGKTGYPPSLAILAMAHHWLGQKDEAKAVLARLREAMKLAGWEMYKPLQNEAGSLIEAKAAPQGG